MEVNAWGMKVITWSLKIQELNPLSPYSHVADKHNKLFFLFFSSRVCYAIGKYIIKKFKYNSETMLFFRVFSYLYPFKCTPTGFVTI